MQSAQLLHMARVEILSLKSEESVRISAHLGNRRPDESKTKHIHQTNSSTGDGNWEGHSEVSGDDLGGAKAFGPWKCRLDLNNLEHAAIWHYMIWYDMIWYDMILCTNLDGNASWHFSLGLGSLCSCIICRQTLRWKSGRRWHSLWTLSCIFSQKGLGGSRWKSARSRYCIYMIN